jgi:hypothetical protein
MSHTQWELGALLPTSSPATVFPRNPGKLLPLLKPISHSVTGNGLAPLAYLRAAEALTWYRATLVGSFGAGRLLADSWATDLRLPPSATLLDSLPLSTCSLWGQAWSKA